MPAATSPENIEERFRSKYRPNPETGCWDWLGDKLKPFAKYPYMNGVMRVRNKRIRAHRISWELRNGPIIGKMFVLHKCNNSLCVNPEHLYLGNHRQNMDDMARSGRAGHTKLSPEQVRMIRSSTLSNPQLASLLGVDKASILAVRKGLSHKFWT